MMKWREVERPQSISQLSSGSDSIEKRLTSSQCSGVRSGALSLYAAQSKKLQAFEKPNTAMQESPNEAPDSQNEAF